MAGQTIITNTVMAETHLTPVAGIVTGGALTVIMPGRCRVAGTAVCEIGMGEGSILPDGSTVAVCTLPGIVIIWALVAYLTIHKLAVVYCLLPAVGGVAQCAGAGIVTIRYCMAGLAIP